MSPPHPPPSGSSAASRRAMARELRARRKALRATLGRRRAAARQELQRRRGALGGRRRRHPLRRMLLAVLVLLLLLLLQDCRCTPPQPLPVIDQPAPSTPAEVVEPSAVPTPRKRSTGRIPRLRRPDYDNELLDPLPWLESYRIQVSSRSVRLAGCFVGAQQPGTLKWAASVEPSKGTLSDQTLEPTLMSDELTRQQRACVFDVLSDPPYDLDSSGERSTPVRVGMVIEF